MSDQKIHPINHSPETLQPKGKSFKILLIADSHLGSDFSFKTRVEKRRRGADFFANFKRALEPAFRKEVDCVVHGGDLFYNSRIPSILVTMAFEL